MKGGGEKSRCTMRLQTNLILNVRTAEFSGRMTVYGGCSDCAKKDIRSILQHPCGSPEILFQMKTNVPKKYSFVSRAAGMVWKGEATRDSVLHN